MVSQNEPPYLPREHSPGPFAKLYMWLILLFVVFVALPFGVHIIYQETIGAWLRKPHARQAQQLREMGQKAAELRKAGKYDEAIELWTQVIESKAKQSDEFFSSAYALRGSCYFCKGDLDQSILDCSKSIELNPEWNLPYNLRGVAFTAKGEHDRAIADQTKALELKPRDSSSLDARALDYYLKGDYLEAAKDWRAALRCCNDEQRKPYLYLWLYVASARAGKADRNDLLACAITHRRDSEQWPIPVVRMLLDEISLDEVLRSANQGNGALRHRCEAHFYIAHRYLMSRDHGKARPHFQQCLDTGATGCSEYTAAKTDLARIR